MFVFNNILRNDTYKENLINFINVNYGIDIISFYEAKRGAYGETWTIECNNNKYFAKIVYYERHMERYIKSFEVVDYMNRNGINYILKILKTSDNRLFCCYDGGIIGIFNYEDGESPRDFSLNDLSLFFTKLALIYNLKIQNIDIQKEDFSMDCIDLLEKDIELLNSAQGKNPTAHQAEMLSFLESNKKILMDISEQYKQISEKVKADSNIFVITSGDVGGSNLLINGDNMILIDWDNIILAPPERDFWLFAWKKEHTALFHAALQNIGIDYKIKFERMEFYRLQNIHYYICEVINSFIKYNLVEQEKSLNTFKESFKARIEPISFYQ